LSRTKTAARLQADDDFQGGGDRVRALAARLFVANWTPTPGHNSDHVAELCFGAAEAFEQVSITHNELQPIDG